MAKCTNREQFNEMLYRTDLTLPPSEIDYAGNNFVNLVGREIADIDMYKQLNTRHVWNTYEYMAGKFKKGGIFMSVRNGDMKRFVSFYDENYRNDFHQFLQFDSRKYRSWQNLIDLTSQRLGRKNKQVILPVEKWCANDGLFRYDTHSAGVSFSIYKDMFDTLCSERHLPDVECFLNKRDFPVLKKNLTEPYDNLYGKDMPMTKHKYDKYSPILSACKTDEFADILIPTYEDWCRAKYQHDRISIVNDKKYEQINKNVDWNLKTAKAVFRGSSTGLGVTEDTNQRLKALKLSLKYPEYLDVGIHKWNLRIRKHINSRYVETIERVSYTTAKFMTLQEQTDKYKYILNLEGHTSAFRLAYELSSNSVVLLAGSDWKVWYSEWLGNGVHYIGVKKDLSDLIEKIEWCKNNERKCLEIIKRANAFYNEYLGYDSILDYLQMTFVRMASANGMYGWISNIHDLVMSSEKNPVAVEYDYEKVCRYDMNDDKKRCIGKLDAIKVAFQHAETINPVSKGLRFENENTTIQLYQTNNIQFVKKLSRNKEKLEHELYIGLHAVNNLLSICMNFAYTYGYHHSDSVAFFREYIHGVSFHDWLGSYAPKHEKTMLDIMVLINLAIITAQTKCGFIHYDLNPRNIILQKLPKAIPIDYNVGLTKPVRYTSNIIPVIIDYGKSRAVVYEEGNGIVDRGIVNHFRHNKSVDMLTLVYTVLSTLKQRNNTSPTLERFLNHYKLSTDIERMSVHGAVIEYTNSDVSRSLSSMTFVKDISTTTKNLSRVDVFNNRMLHGVAYIEEMKMRLNDNEEAIRLAVMRLDKQRIPRCKNKTVRRMIELSLKRRMSNLDTYVNVCKNKHTKERYDKVKRLVMDFNYKAIPSEINIGEFPSPDLTIVDLDIRMSLEELEEMKMKCNDYRENDWLGILSWIVDSQIDDPTLKIIQNIDLFDYINAIASHNTCLRLYSQLYNDDI